jgi:acyl carrier protein
LEFLGRIDSQVKIRGFRVELGEIDTVLRTHPEVRDASSRLWNDDDHPRIASYVVVSGDVASAEIRAHCRRLLPEYMVPAHVLVLPELPLTPNGKVDRNALPPPSRERAEGERRRIPPRTDTERGLALVWQDILKLDEVGVDENFFQLGGHSLLATRVASQVRERFGVDLPLRDVFEAATIADLGAKIEELQRAGRPVADGPALVPLPRTALRSLPT